MTAVGLGYAEAGRGAGPTLVALHGGVVAGRLAFGPVLDAWASRLRVLTPDRRGFERTPDPAHGTIEDQANDLLAFLAGHAPHGRAHVLGASFGGVVALTALQIDPAPFRSLILVEAPAVSLCADDPDVAAWMRELNDIHALLSRQEGREDAEALLRRFLTRTDPAGVEPMLRLLQAGDPGVRIDPDELLPWRTPLRPDDVRGTGVPALVVTGADTVPIFTRVADLTAGVLDAERLVVARTGHAAHLSGRRFLEPLRAFIAHAEAEGVRHEPVAVVAPDPTWPAAFVDERRVLARAMGDRGLGIEHIGSTAVAGLPAKPVIDVMVGVEDLVAAVTEVCPRIEATGYSWWRDNPRAGEHAFLVRAADGQRVAHVHVAARDGAFWREHLAFRDRLRGDARTREAYARLKQDLASRLGHDREAYTRAKAAFVGEALSARSRGAW